MFKAWLLLRYLGSVSTRQTEFNDEDGLGGDDGVGGGVGRRGDDWVCAAFSFLPKNKKVRQQPLNSINHLHTPAKSV